MAEVHSQLGGVQFLTLQLDTIFHLSRQDVIDHNLSLNTTPFATNLEKHLHTVDQEEDDHNEQESRVASVEEVGTSAGEQMRVGNFRQE